MSITRDRDVELWQRWHATRSNADLEALMRQMMPVMQGEIRAWSKVMPPIVAEAEAKRLALKAFETYNPAMVPPVLLSTHVVNQLQKLKRMGYEHQSSVSIPEHQRITFNKMKRIEADLENDLGRKPTFHEVADHMAMPPDALRRIASNVERKEFMESGEGPAFLQHDDDDFIHMAYHDMTPMQRQIFEMRTGYTGTSTADMSRIRSGEQITRQLNISQAQLSYQIKLIEKMLHQAEGLRT